jgi:hypothetical protein
MGFCPTVGSSVEQSAQFQGDDAILRMTSMLNSVKSTAACWTILIFKNLQHESENGSNQLAYQAGM